MIKSTSNGIEGIITTHICLCGVKHILKANSNWTTEQFTTNLFSKLDQINQCVCGLKYYFNRLGISKILND